MKRIPHSTLTILLQNRLSFLPNLNPYPYKLQTSLFLFLVVQILETQFLLSVQGPESKGEKVEKYSVVRQFFVFVVLEQVLAYFVECLQQKSLSYFVMDQALSY